MQDFRLNDAVVRPRLNEICIDGRSEKLPAKFIDVLMVLAERRGEVFGKDELLKRVWNDPLIGDDSLANAVWMLRKTLGDDAKRPAYIETVPRRGYRLIAEVSPVVTPPEALAAGRVPDDVPAPAPEAAVDVPLERAPRRQRPLLVAAVAALIVAAAIVGLLRWQERPAGTVAPGASVFAFRTGGNSFEITMPVAGTALIASNAGRFYAVDTDTGTERWRFEPSDSVALPWEAHDGKVYLGSDDGHLYALDVVNGHELWRHAAGAAVTTVPHVRDGIVVYGDIKGNVRALASADAKPLWEAKLEQRVSGQILALLDLAIVRSIDGSIVAFDRASGKVRWRRRFEGRLTDMVASAPDELAFASEAGWVATLDAASGKTRWQSAIAAVEVQPLVAGDRVFALGRYGDFAAFARGDGHVLWRTRLDLADLYDIVWWSDRLVVVLDGGALGVIDPRDGKLERSLMLGEIPDCVEADRTRLIVPTQSGRVLALDRAVLSTQPLGRLLLDASGRWARPQASAVGRYAIEPLRSGVPMPELAWRVPVVGDVQDVNVAEDGTVYFGDERGATAISADGTVLWRTPLERALATEFALGDDTVYFGRHDHDVYALDRATGRERWRHATGDMIIAPPTLTDSKLLVGSDDNALHALDAKSGKELWSFKTEKKVRGAAAVAGTLAIFGSGDHHVYAVDLETGAKRWEFTAEDWVVAHPIVRDGRVFFGSGDGVFRALALDTGHEIWRVRTAAAIWYRPAADADAVYFGSGDGYIYAVDQATGTERWRFRTGSAAEGSVVLADGVLYAGSHDSHLYALETKTGKPLWRLRTGGSVFNPKVAGGAVYVTSADQHLYALKLP